MLLNTGRVQKDKHSELISKETLESNAPNYKY